MNGDIDFIAQQGIFDLFSEDPFSTDALYRSIDETITAGFDCYQFDLSILLIIAAVISSNACFCCSDRFLRLPLSDFSISLRRMFSNRWRRAVIVGACSNALIQRANFWTSS